MQSTAERAGPDLSGLDWNSWLGRLEPLLERDGYLAKLGAEHAAVFVGSEPVLLVTFENFERLDTLSSLAHPLGWSLRPDLGCSHLGLISRDGEWFQNDAIPELFAELENNGFFEQYDQVVFYGADTGGYAATVCSVAATGSRVLAVQPRLTFASRIAELEARYAWMQRSGSKNRISPAPEIDDTASQCVVISDPELEVDENWKEMFWDSGTLKFCVRHLGYDIEATLIRMGFVVRAMSKMQSAALTRLDLGRLWRGRRTERRYLLGLLRRLVADHQDRLLIVYCNYVLEHKMGGPRFRKARNAAQDRIENRSGAD